MCFKYSVLVMYCFIKHVKSIVQINQRSFNENSETMFIHCSIEKDAVTLNRATSVRFFFEATAFVYMEKKEEISCEIS